MRKVILILLLTLSLIFTSAIPLYSNLLEFVAGWGTGFLLHELAHGLVGSTTGEIRFYWDSSGEIRWLYKGSSKGLFKTASAGLQANWWLREYYLTKRPKSDFWNGAFCWSLYSSLYYCFANDGDIQAMNQASGISIDTLHIVNTILTLLDVYRYFYPSKDLKLISRVSKTIILGYIFQF